MIDIIIYLTFPRDIEINTRGVIIFHPKSRKNICTKLALKGLEQGMKTVKGMGLQYVCPVTDAVVVIRVCKLSEVVETMDIVLCLVDSEILIAAHT